MGEYLRLNAQQAQQIMNVELFLYIQNPNSDKLTATWKIELPPHLKLLLGSSPLKGTQEVQRNEGKVHAGSWRLEVQPLRGQAEREIVASATLGSDEQGTAFADSVRGLLSGLLQEGRPRPLS